MKLRKTDSARMSQHLSRRTIPSSRRVYQFISFPHPFFLFISFPGHESLEFATQAKYNSGLEHSEVQTLTTRMRREYSNNDSFAHLKCDAQSTKPLNTPSMNKTFTPM